MRGRKGGRGSGWERAGARRDSLALRCPVASQPVGPGSLGAIAGGCEDSLVSVCASEPLSALRLNSAVGGGSWGWMVETVTELFPNRWNPHTINKHRRREVDD